MVNVNKEIRDEKAILIEENLKLKRELLIKNTETYIKGEIINSLKKEINVQRGMIFTMGLAILIGSFIVKFKN